MLTKMLNAKRGTNLGIIPRGLIHLELCLKSAKLTSTTLPIIEIKSSHESKNLATEKAWCITFAIATVKPRVLPPLLN